MTDLRRQLSLFDAVTINVGTMIASAIFVVPSTVALHLGYPGLAILVWVAGGLVSLLGALCMAELAAAFPRAGGLFVYLREGVSPVWGFLYGWTNAVLINPASIAAIGIVFASYLGFLVPLTPNQIKLVAIGSIVALTALNCRGVREGAMTQNVLTTIKVVALLGLIAVALVAPAGSLAHFGAGAGPPGGLLSGLALAMVAVLWAYDGWIEVTYVGSEVVDPGRNLPRSIIWSMVVVVGLYSLVNVAFLYVLPPSRMAGSAIVASDVATAVIGSAGAGVVAAMIMLATLGGNNGIVLTAARIPYAMAREGRFFGWAGRVHPTRGTPVASLVGQGVVAVGFALTGTYNALFTYIVFASWVFYAMGCFALLRLRRDRPDLPRPYRVWGYPLTPLVFIGFALWLVGSTVVETPREAVIGALLIAAGLPGYWYWSRRRPAVATA